MEPLERAHGVISDTLRADAHVRKDDWDSHLALAEFAINNAATTLGNDLTPFFIDRGALPRLSLSPPRDDRATCESPTQYAQRMRAMESTVRQLLAAAQAERKAKHETRKMLNAARPSTSIDSSPLPAPGPVQNMGQEVWRARGSARLLLNGQLVRSVLSYLVRWRGYTWADGT